MSATKSQVDAAAVLAARNAADAASAAMRGIAKVVDEWMRAMIDAFDALRDAILDALEALGEVLGGLEEGARYRVLAATDGTAEGCFVAVVSPEGGGDPMMRFLLAEGRPPGYLREGALIEARGGWSAGERAAMVCGVRVVTAAETIHERRAAGR